MKSLGRTSPIDHDAYDTTYPVIKRVAPGRRVFVCAKHPGRTAVEGSRRARKWMTLRSRDDAALEAFGVYRIREQHYCGECHSSYKRGTLAV